MGDVIPPRHAPALDAVACALMEAWQDAEGSPVGVSYVATYVDLARAALDAVAGMLLDETPAADALRERLGMEVQEWRRCTACGSVSQGSDPFLTHGMHLSDVDASIVLERVVMGPRRTTPVEPPPPPTEDELAKLRSWLQGDRRG